MKIISKTGEFATIKTTMKTTELRIGNYLEDERGLGTVNYIDYKSGRNVIVIGLKYANKGSSSRPFNIDEEIDYKPIPLTEEWLIKFGFEYSSGEWIRKGDVYCNCFEKDEDVIYYTGGEGIRLSREINTVHDFQNIYFALTGEELTIKK